MANTWTQLTRLIKRLGRNISSAMIIKNSNHNTLYKTLLQFLFLFLCFHFPVMYLRDKFNEVHLYIFSECPIFNNLILSYLYIKKEIINRIKTIELNHAMQGWGHFFNPFLVSGAQFYIYSVFSLK